MKYCKTCRYKNKYGDCDNPKITDSLPENQEIDTDDMIIYSYAEEGEFHVGDYFGCVHHKEKGV